MNIALIGYGKMGKAIEQEALARNHTIQARIDLHNKEELKSLNPNNTDAVIEFTHPSSFEGNLHAVMALGIPMVTGTTGWHDNKEAVEAAVNKVKGSLIHSSNFSIGVNVLFMLNQRLAAIMNQYPEYDCYIEEQHHRHKADAPSGTAHSLAQQVLAELERKNSIASDELRHRAPTDDELSVGYIRSGEIIGTHRVAYTSEIDSIRIEHQAYNRRGFALGAVVAAEWIVGKTGIYEFSELF
ncbi:MAG: 4-hydroxy-tetrahydrodipicolinate reductase [Bacteroidota bacterium]